MPTQIAMGSPAPDFTLHDERGNVVSLASFRGKQPVVLIFYPGDETLGCIKQLCAIRDDWQEFQQAGIVVFGVNHADAESHKKFIEHHGLKNPLLIDPNRKVSAIYGATKKYFGHDTIKRSVVVIDKQGIIRYLKRGLPANSEFLPLAKELAHG